MEDYKKKIGLNKVRMFMTTQMSFENIKNKTFLLFIMLIAISARLYGIRHNLPYFENTDEIFIINMSKFVAMNGYNHISYLNLYYPYPPFVYLINSIVYNLYSFFSGMPLESIPRGDLGLISRIITALFGTATVLVTYFIGKKSYNKNIGLISSAILAVMFLHVTNSQLTKNDIATTFFGSIAIYFAISALKDKNTNKYFISAFFAGISTATLYQGIFFIVPLLASHSLNVLNREKNYYFTGRNLIILLTISLSFLIGFFIVNPYYLLSLIVIGLQTHFDLLDQILATMLAFDSGIVTWKWYLEYLWAYGLYYPIFILFIGGTISIVRKKEKAGAVLLSIVLVYGITLILKTYYTDRLLLPITPTIAVISAYFLSNVSTNLRKRSFVFNNIKIHSRNVCIFVILVVFGISLLKVAIGGFYLSQPTPLQQMEAWTDKNVPTGSRIFFTADPLPFSPNNLEKKYNITYYSPEMAQYPIDVLSLKYDYVIYYWGSNLPAELNLKFSQTQAEKSFSSKISDHLPLKPFVNISSPWFSGRMYYNVTASLIILNTTPQNNYGFIYNTYYEAGNLKGNILYFISNNTSENKFLITKNIIKPIKDNYIGEMKDFKPHLNHSDLTFSFDIQTKKLISSSSNKELNSNLTKIERDLFAFLNKGFNVEQEHEISIEISNEDLVSYAGVPSPSGKNDLLITIKNVSKPIKKAQIFNRYKNQTWVGPHDGIHATALLKQELDAGSVIIYIEPVEWIQDDKFEVYLFYADDTIGVAANH